MEQEVVIPVPGVPGVPGAKQHPQNLFDALASWGPSEVDVSDWEHREQLPERAEGEATCVVLGSAHSGPAYRERREKSDCPPPFDGVAARALLTRMHADLDRAAQQYGRGFPPPIDGAVRACVEACEDYVANAEAERGRGWCPMTLLRNGIALALRVARKGRTAPW